MTVINRFASTLVGILALVLLLPNPAAAQDYLNQNYLFAPTNGESFASQLQPQAGGYFVSGNRALTLAGKRELTVAILDSAGVVTRQRIYAHDSITYTSGAAGALLALPTGGYVQIVKQFNVRRSLHYNAMIWWFDAQGDTVRTTIYRAAPYDLYVNHICQLASGGFVIVGAITQTPNAVNSFAQWFAIGTDAQGRERWRHTWNLLGDGFAYNVLATPDGGALITGIARPQLLATDYYYRNHMAAVKIDSAGNTQWQRAYADSTDGLAAQCLADGSYLIGGTYIYVRTPVRVLRRVALYHLDSLGNLLSRRDYGPKMDAAETKRMHTLPDGSLVLAGSSSDSAARAATGVSAITGFALKLCPDGDSVWWRTYRYYANPYCNNYLWDFAPTPDGGFAGAGFLHARAAGGQAAEAWVIKADADGYLTAGGPPSAITCRPVGLPDEPTEAAELAVYPNPSPDGWFTLEAGATPLAPRSYAVFDALGRCVATGQLTDKQTRLDLRARPPGLYVLHLRWPDGRSTTRKLVR